MDSYINTLQKFCLLPNKTILVFSSMNNVRCFCFVACFIYIFKFYFFLPKVLFKLKTVADWRLMFTSALSNIYLSGTVLLSPALMLRVGVVTVQETRTTVFLQVKSQRAFFSHFPSFVQCYIFLFCLV